MPARGPVAGRPGRAARHRPGAPARRRAPGRRTRRQPTWPPPRSEPPSWAAGSNSRYSCRAATTETARRSAGCAAGLAAAQAAGRPGQGVWRSATPRSQARRRTVTAVRDALAAAGLRRGSGHRRDQHLLQRAEPAPDTAGPGGRAGLVGQPADPRVRRLLADGEPAGAAGHARDRAVLRAGNLAATSLRSRCGPASMPWPLPTRSSPAGGLPWQVDVRQPSLFGAAWTLGSFAALAGGGADGLTYYDTQGPAGVVESAAGSPNPAEFFSRPDTPYPLAVVLADACALAGGRSGRWRGLDPARAGRDRRRGGSDRHRPHRPARQPHRPRPATSASSWPARQPRRAPGSLTSTASPRPPADLPAFLASRTDLPVSEGAVTVTLHPYATARLDLSGE